MSFSIIQKKPGGTRGRAAGIAQGFAITACLAAILAPRAWAEYWLPTDAATLNGTSIAADGHCNLTEAIASVNIGQPINGDCLGDGSDDRNIFLSGTEESTPVYQLASGTTISTTWGPVAITSEYPAVIEAPGPAVLTVNAGASLSLTGIVVRHKAGSQGRVIMNHGTFDARWSTFQDGDISGWSWPSDGAGIYNDGNIPEMAYCVIKNNKAPNGSGGGIYNRGWIGDGTGSGLYSTAVTNNIAAQGGGIYSVRNDGPDAAQQQGQLTLKGASLNGNKTIANEVTAGGTFSSGGGNSCTGSETPAQAFDDNFNTKWCASGSAPPSPSAPLFVIYQFGGGAKQRVQSYSVTSANDLPQRDPADWTLAGSNSSGGPWTTLDTRTGEWFAMYEAVPAGKGGRFLTRTYYFKNPNAYAYYRFRVTKNNGSTPFDASIPGSGTTSKLTQFAELQLYADWKTGDGAGLFYTTHANFENTTFSRNIAGCINSSCACPAGDDWCANPSNTKMTWGRGGGILASEVTPENGFPSVGETVATSLTVAGNSASQGGGFYQSRYSHWEYKYSLFGKNNARTNVSKEPDFHGNPHDGTFGRGGDLFSNQNGLVGGFRITGPEPDKVAADPKLRALACGSGDMKEFCWHMPQTGSPAVDGTSINDQGVDQRNYSRPSGSSWDFGSIERQPGDP
ncbi:MAG TPA: choice-of-anchor Q domain-containing protein [Fibrobacteria bacterium]|nr:choice-of-anchor Q domain-containing protein [Fibrobacteria bacterium]